jgi:hypothetical protein
MKDIVPYAKPILLALSLLPLAIASVEAGHHKKGDRLNVVAARWQSSATTLTYAQFHHCDWVGPGARAVYRCNLAEPSQPLVVVSQDHAPRRVCDWIGSGARAQYMCRYY